MDQVGKPILELTNIRKAFGEKLIHQGVSFSLTTGESLGLLGGSGTGKSVLLRSIIGLEQVDSGDILYHGEKLTGLGEKEYTPYRTRISYAFQSGALFDSLNVYNNIAYPLYEHTDLSEEQIHIAVQNSLRLIDLNGIEEQMPADLSGGQQKRVGLARAMIMKPEIILYDEPTAGLDPTNTKNIVRILKRLKQKGQSSIFVTHDIPSALELCDRILILNQGKIAFNGTPSEMQESEDPIVTSFLYNEGY